MERLIYSNPLPSKLNPRHTTTLFLPRLDRIHDKLGSFSFPARRINSISCCYQQDRLSNSLSLSQKSFEVVEDCKRNSSSSVDLSDRSPHNVLSVKKLVESCTRKEKVRARFCLIDFWSSC